MNGIAAQLQRRPLAMSVIAQSPKVVAALFAASLFAYAGGAYLALGFICQPAAAGALFAGVAIGSIACAMLGFSAIRLHSMWRTLGAVASALVLVAMYLLMGVLTLPGCSGV